MNPCHGSHVSALTMKQNIALQNDKLACLQGYSLSGGKSSFAEPAPPPPAPKGPARPAAVSGLAAPLYIMLCLMYASGSCTNACKVPGHTLRTQIPFRRAYTNHENSCACVFEISMTGSEVLKAVVLDVIDQNIMSTFGFMFTIYMACLLLAPPHS